MRPRVLITGGARGIGRATAVAFAGAGWDVVVNDIIPVDETLAAIAEKGGAGKFVEGSVGDVAGHGRLVEAAWACFGGIEALVNNAGISVGRRGDMLETTPESFDRLIAVNLRGPFFLTQAVARRWLAEPAGTQVRSVISIASANSFMASPDRAEYCLSKTGVSMMTKLFALRLAEAGIGVFEIRPGVIRTDMTAVVKDSYERRIADGLTPIRRWGEPEDVAKVIALLAQGSFHFSTGEAFHVDGGPVDTAAVTKIFLAHAPHMLANYYGERALAALRSHGEVILNTTGRVLDDPAALAAAAGDAQIVVADRQTPAPQAFFAAMPELVAICRVAVDIRNIDVAAASQHGVLVTQATPGFIDAVAELGLGLMIDLARGISRSVGEYPRGARGGGRDRAPVARRDARHHRLWRDRRTACRHRTGARHECAGQRSVQGRGGRRCRRDRCRSCWRKRISWSALAVATPATENLMDEAAFAAMRPDACFINLSRGNLVDEGGAGPGAGRKAHRGGRHGCRAGAGSDALAASGLAGRCHRHAPYRRPDARSGGAPGLRHGRAGRRPGGWQNPRKCGEPGRGQPPGPIAQQYSVVTEGRMDAGYDLIEATPVIRGLSPPAGDRRAEPPNPPRPRRRGCRTRFLPWSSARTAWRSGWAG